MEVKEFSLIESLLCKKVYPVRDEKE